MPDAAATSSQPGANSNQAEATEITHPATSHRKGGRAAVIRMYVLLAVLATLLFALWYDYRVARVGVDQAYATIADLNDARNSAAGMSSPRAKMSGAFSAARPRGYSKKDM